MPTARKKLKQKYLVEVMHRATIPIEVVANNRAEAREKALEVFVSGGQLDADFTNLEAIVHKVTYQGLSK